jgi:hypothetical protein
VVQLDPEASTGDREVEAFVLNAQFVEISKRLAGEVADLRVVAFAFKLGNDDNGKNYGMLCKAKDRLRIRQKDGRVENVGTFRLPSLRVGPILEAFLRLRVGELGHVYSVPGA